MTRLERWPSVVESQIATTILQIVAGFSLERIDVLSTNDLYSSSARKGKQPFSFTGSDSFSSHAVQFLGKSSKARFCLLYILMQPTTGAVRWSNAPFVGCINVGATLS
jgi:hypothetical protein